MRAFRFRLDRVLDWYREQCEIEEARLGQCMAAVAAILENAARLEAERQAVDQEMILRATIPARELMALGLYRLRATERAAALEVERAKRQAEADRQRVQVQAARRKVRLVEKLRERRLAEHKEAEDKELETLAAESYLAKWIQEEQANQRGAAGHR